MQHKEKKWSNSLQRMREHTDTVELENSQLRDSVRALEMMRLQNWGRSVKQKARKSTKAFPPEHTATSLPTFPNIVVLSDSESRDSTSNIYAAETNDLKSYKNVVANDQSTSTSETMSSAAPSALLSKQLTRAPLSFDQTGEQNESNIVVGARTVPSSIRALGAGHLQESTGDKLDIGTFIQKLESNMAKFGDESFSNKNTSSSEDAGAVFSEDKPRGELEPSLCSDVVDLNEYDVEGCMMKNLATDRRTVKFNMDPSVSLIDNNNLGFKVIKHPDGKVKKNYNQRSKLLA